ncbi:Uncharacterised protein [Salmonella enterica subsp. enterica serovar Gallinarum]|nr:Uncharacterised protein [Salmonella enterica subsp. enterica serovar Gallinarum]
MPPAVSAGGDVGNGPVATTFHQATGFSGAENIDTGNERRLHCNTESRAVGPGQVIFFNNTVQRIAQGDAGVDMLLNDAVVSKRVSFSIRP